MRVLSFQSIGPVRFGMAREEVQSTLKSEFTSFKKAYFSQNESEYYRGHGLVVHYDAEDRVEFVEAFAPSNPTIKEVPLIGRAFSEIREQLAAKGIALQSTDSGYEVGQLGFGLYLKAETVEGVYVFRKGYFEA